MVASVSQVQQRALLKILTSHDHGGSGCLCSVCCVNVTLSVYESVQGCCEREVRESSCCAEHNSCSPFPCTHTDSYLLRRYESPVNRLSGAKVPHLGSEFILKGVSVATHPLCPHSLPSAWESGPGWCAMKPSHPQKDGRVFISSMWASSFPPVPWSHCPLSVCP